MERLTEASSQRTLIWADKEEGRVEGKERRVRDQAQESDEEKE